MTDAAVEPLYIKMHPADNVAIVANDGGLPAGTQFACGLRLVEHVPQGHKVALVDIPSGVGVTRYNVTIGYALDDIPAGAWINEFKLRMPPWEEVEPRDFTQLLRKVRQRPDAALIESVLLRSQSLAIYSPNNTGHFGLALDAYAHFTSPIRRYADLLVHRAIGHAIDGGSPSDYIYDGREMTQFALECSERSRRAEEAEREVDDRYRCAWMEQHVGGVFEGVISGVTSFGLFVELIESRVNGLVHVTQLPGDYYHFDPVRKLLQGERTGKIYRLGDRVRVLVLRASIEDRKIDFRLVGEDANDGDRRLTKAAQGNRKGKAKR